MTALLNAGRGYLEHPKLAEPEGDVTFSGSPSSDQLAALKKLIAVSDEFDFHLLIVANPFPESLRSPPIELQLQELETGIERVAGSSNRVRVMLPVARFYESGECATPAHLTPVGAARNSLELCQFIVTAAGLVSGW
jgi:hypothetical protein